MLRFGVDDGVNTHDVSFTRLPSRERLLDALASILLKSGTPLCDIIGLVDADGVIFHPLVFVKEPHLARGIFRILTVKGVLALSHGPRREVEFSDASDASTSESPFSGEDDITFEDLYNGNWHARPSSSPRPSSSSQRPVTPTPYSLDNFAGPDPSDPTPHRRGGPPRAR
jgi:hypothetical protein